MQNRVERLHDRAEMFRRARRFFSDRSVTEVDVPLVSSRASVDQHIDLLSVEGGRYLHSSPEYGMKRLLGEGIGDIYQLSHVFRRGELGSRHNPEFTMAEWYRIGLSFQGMIDETVDFIELFIGKRKIKQKSYREMFLEHTSIDIFAASLQELVEYCVSREIPCYEGIESEGVDALLNVILATVVEPKLAEEELFVVTHFPASQAALAETVTIDGIEVAERFEVYFRGIELANGYHELTDQKEQRRRLIEANAVRKRDGKEELPIDDKFLKALDVGLPDCCGVAVGFDRCMMVRHEARCLAEVIPFGWEEA